MNILSRSSLPLMVLTVMLLFVSCVPQKKLRYLQDSENAGGLYDSGAQPEEPRLKPHDLVQIQVFSASSELYRTPGFEVSTNLGTTASIYLQGYAVGINGELFLPVLGTFQVEGLTISELRDILTDAARQKINLDADVVVRMVNFRISVLGEVRNPGVFEVFDHRITLLEALARSGDLTVYGNRQNVMLIREINNKKEVIILDLTDRALLSSPHLLLQNNDIIYVQPLNAKSFGFAQVQWGIIISSISTLIAILALVTRP
jgi:polysaccharide biosynthesis/export protein